MFKEIRKLYKQGCKNIAGLDEAGRGPLAGPVVVCVVAVDFLIRGGRTSRGRSDLQILEGVKDSKKLSGKQREKWYKILTNHSDIEWAVASVNEKVIDKINILEATKLAMRRAVVKLKTQPDFLIIDGNFTLDAKTCFGCSSKIKPVVSLPVIASQLKNFGTQQKSIIKADEKIFVCAAASIIAKVTRDRIMRRLHKKYPQYGFDRHKGYGTKKHLRALRKHGPCKIHRRSFRPIRRIG